jgi:hypothetical protein
MKRKKRRMRRWESGEDKNKGNEYQVFYVISTFLLSGNIIRSFCLER